MPYTDSDVETASIEFSGVWLHDEEGTIGPHNFPYGSSARDTSIDTMGTGTFYAGRVAPVFDFGEHESNVVGVSVDVPHGPDYRASLALLEEFARSRRPVWFRDNRGRVVYGVMRSFKHTDEAWGSVVSFNVEAVHRDITTAVV